MAYVTYKNRNSTDYRFTCKTLDDPAISELKEMLKTRNKWITDSRKRYPDGYASDIPTQGLRIRPRGPRPSQWAKDTPWENATHYDVYIRDYPTTKQRKSWGF